MTKLSRVHCQARPNIKRPKKRERDLSCYGSEDEGIQVTTAAKAMASSSALRELQRELEAKANDLSKIQKGKP
ncbi:hypothetical protein ACE6H2_013552 [Prunus campanulata]